MLWADFRQFLPENSWAGEDKLWEELFTECKWLITRGQQYLCNEPGWFRVMFTSQEWHSEEKISAPFEVLQQRLVLWKQKREQYGAAPITAKIQAEAASRKEVTNFAHFCLENDEEMEEMEQGEDLINA